LPTGPASHPSRQGSRQAPRRQGLRQRRAAPVAQRSSHQARHPQSIKSNAAVQLRQKILQAAAPHRECLLSPQGLPAHRNPLRQAGTKLPRLSLSGRCHRLVDLMSLDPSRLTSLSIE